MPDNEKQLLEDLAALPKPIREDFLRQITGAATAVRVLATEAAAAGENKPESKTG